MFQEGPLKDFWDSQLVHSGGKSTWKFNKLVAEFDEELIPLFLEIEKKVGISFNNKNLLIQAFTHPSIYNRSMKVGRTYYIKNSYLGTQTELSEIGVFGRHGSSLCDHFVTLHKLSNC